jgi:murein DD-endopeptidase MepM/ murein hydrolase activator NlpD
MKKLGFGIAASLVLAGCAQSPAPVVSGYESQPQVPLRRMAEGDAPRLLEPTGVAAAPQKTINGVPVMAVSKVEDLPPAQNFNVEPAAGPAVQQASATPSQPVAQPAMVEHTVAGTDSIYKIASQYNTTARAVMATNGITDPAAIKVGQVLKVQPGAKGPSAWEEMQAVLAGDDAKKVAAAAPAPQPAPKVVASVPPAAEPVKLAEISPAAGPDVQWVKHKVEAKETIYRISKTYNVSVLDIMAANDFEKPQDLKYGTEVKIPVRGQPTSQIAVKKDAELAKVEPAAGDGRETDRRLAMLDPKDLEKTDITPQVEAVVPAVKDPSLNVALMEKQRGHVDTAANKARGLVWPVKGDIVRRFGDEGSGVAFTGINIAVPAGTPVLASEGGTVLYADDGLKIYGKMVLLRHDNGMVSAYAHNGYLLVNKGDRVKKGQVIAMSGATGNVDSPQLHFELRQHASAVDPLRMLPKL